MTYNDYWEFSFEIRDAETDELVHSGTAPAGEMRLPDWVPSDREYYGLIKGLSRQTRRIPEPEA